MSVTMPSESKPSFNAPDLRSELMRLRAVDNVTNLGYLAGEYLSLAAVIGGTILFCERRGSWGLAWAWDVPVVALAVVLVGALQHRLAGLGHEASHYTLLRNKFWNDLVGDLLCMFPVLSTIHFYRVFHMAHHQFTNDPERDPDLVTLGGSKMVDQFPMGRWAFAKAFYLRPFTDPVAFARYQIDYIAINVLGSSENVYLGRSGGGTRAWPRLGSSLGMAYLLGVVAGSWVLTMSGHAGWLVPFGVASAVFATAVAAVLPDRAFFPTPFRQPFSPRVSGVLRLAFYTAVLISLSLLRDATGGRSTVYFLLLWAVPLGSTFMFYMLLRDVYQHTNADDGRLTNSRVFFADPFTRWAVFVYGQDMHVPHHLFPAIPHYRLPGLHRLLKARHGDYARQVVECHGTFGNGVDHPTILDVLTSPAALREDGRG